MRRLLLCVALLLSANAYAEGQEAEARAEATPSAWRPDASKGEAARLLESQSNRERAWGAFLAGRNEFEELTPALVRTASDPALGDDEEGRLVRQAALDALIRLGAKVPPEVLRALPPRFSDEALVLLAAAPEENRPALLEMFASMHGDEGPNIHWLAFGNLLAETKAQGFAALLLRDLRVEAQVTVLDREGEEGVMLGDGGGCGCCLFYQPPEGFPPVSYYDLTAYADRHAVVVAPGRHPVYYTRTLSPAGGDGYSMPRVRDLLRVEYLEELLGTSGGSIDFDPRPSETIVCKGARQCLRELEGVRARVAESYEALVGLLVREGRLDGAWDAPAVPPMTFTLYDRRRRKTFPLPEALEGVTVEVVDEEPAPDDDEAAEAAQTP